MLKENSGVNRVWNKIKQKFSGMTRGRPGERFQRKYAKHGGRPPSTLMTAVYVTAGCLLVLAGLFFSLVPGVPGIVLVLPGLFLLAVRFRHMAALLDKTELIGRRIIDWVRSRKNR
jgi:hypothetical protein